VSPTSLPDAFAHLQHAAGNRAVAEMVVRAGVVKVILATLRGMAGRRFGPAATPSAAEALARADFDKQLPPALSVSQPAYRGVWITVLDASLKARDAKGWHNLANGTMATEGGKWVYPLEQTGTTKIGSVASDQVVNYPTASP
jgi:hypothetical protein